MAVEFAQDLLLSADASVNVVTLLEVPISVEENVTGLSADVDKTRSRFAESKYVEILTVCWLKELLKETKKRQSEKVSV